MELLLSLRIEGEPVPQGRPCFSKAGRRALAFTPQRSREYKARVQGCALRSMRGRKPLLGALKAEISIFITPPGSWSRKRKELAYERTILPAVRPDIDNYAKAILDGLNGICFKDDGQIVSLAARKLYAKVEAAEVLIYGKRGQENEQ